MGIQGKTIKEIITEYKMSKEEAEGFEKMVSMIMVLRKHLHLKSMYENAKE